MGNKKNITHTNRKLTVFHCSGADSRLEYPKGNANFVGSAPEGLKCVAQIANTRESPFNPQVQNANTLRLAKCWNMFDEMLDFIKAIENDDDVLPKFMEKERKRIIRKEARYAK